MSPTKIELECARARLQAEGFTDEQCDQVTGLGLRRTPHCPPEAPIVVKVAAGALSINGARQALALANAKPPPPMPLSPSDEAIAARLAEHQPYGDDDAECLIADLAQVPMRDSAWCSTFRLVVALIDDDRFWAIASLARSRKTTP